MVSLRRPSTEMIREFLESQSKLGFTYPAVGATETVPPVGYDVDHTRIKLGEGQEVFTRAKAALRRREQFRLGWVEAWSPKTTIETGDVMAVVARMVGLWWLNACRIVYVVDEEEPIPRYGFAYGTLPDHVETGEERFLVEWDRASGEVWYDILAFSRPQLLLTQMGYPYVRRVQKQFAKASASAMLRVVNNVEQGSDGEKKR
ncbi:MAG TPA: DUF1990 domain-containing protein [Isosphaeraceae bacterium]|nr:DUF1990 domain-containing protein [Isosphaeraceae bacterium]